MNRGIIYEIIGGIVVLITLGGLWHVIATARKALEEIAKEDRSPKVRIQALLGRVKPKGRKRSKDEQGS